MLSLGATASCFDGTADHCKSVFIADLLNSSVIGSAMWFHVGDGCGSQGFLTPELSSAVMAKNIAKTVSGDKALKNRLGSR